MRPHISTHQAARTTAALASLGAGAIHAAVVPNHLAVWWASGLFFILLATFQVLWAGAVLWSGNRTLLLLGIVVSIGSIALWTATRVWGQPVGPSAGTPLPVGPSGVLSLLLEAVVIGAGAWAIRDPGTRRLRGLAAAAPLTAALAGVVALTVPGISAALEHDHASHAGGDDHHEETGGHGDGPSKRQGNHGTSSPSPSPTRSGSGGGSGSGSDSHGHDDHAH